MSDMCKSANGHSRELNGQFLEIVGRFGYLGDIIGGRGVHLTVL